MCQALSSELYKHCLISQNLMKWVLLFLLYRTKTKLKHAQALWSIKCQQQQQVNADSSISKLKTSCYVVIARGKKSRHGAHPVWKMWVTRTIGYTWSSLPPLIGRSWLAPILCTFLVSCFRVRTCSYSLPSPSPLLPNLLFQIILNLQKNCKSHTQRIYIQLPLVNIIHNHNTMIETRKLVLIQYC